MTDPHPDRTTRGAPLEPWELDLLNESEAADPQARQETERVVALLRSLETPEVDSRRADRLILALSEQTSRPTLIHVAFGAARNAFRPPVALALAAGLAGLFAITIAPDRIPLLLEPAVDSTTVAAPVATPQRVAADDLAESTRREPIRRRTTPVVRPQLVNVSALSPSSMSASRDRFNRAPYEPSYDYGLDRQLNQLMIDPEAFAVRLESIGQRDRFIARLAERAAERGDAPEIALRVRQSRHPLAGQLVDRLLRSTFVASVSPR